MAAEEGAFGSRFPAGGAVGRFFRPEACRADVIGGTKRGTGKKCRCGVV